MLLLVYSQLIMPEPKQQQFKIFNESTQRLESLLNQLSYLVPVLNKIVILYADTTPRYFVNTFNRIFHSFSLDNTQFSPLEKYYDFFSDITSQLEIGSKLVFHINYNNTISLIIPEIRIVFGSSDILRFDIKKSTDGDFMIAAWYVENILNSKGGQVLGNWLVSTITIEYQFQNICITGRSQNGSQLWLCNRPTCSYNPLPMGLIVFHTNTIQSIRLS